VARADTSDGRCHAGHAWLPAMLPENGRRFRVLDRALAETLGVAGAEVSTERPDVEIGAADQLTGDAEEAVVVLGELPRDIDSRFRRVASRISQAGLVRVDSVRVRRRLRRLGYAETGVVPWDLAQPLRLPGGANARRRPVAEYFPHCAVAFGRRSPGAARLLDAGIDDARRMSGHDFEVEQLSVREGILVALGRDAVLRIAVGPGRAQIRRQSATLAHLRRVQAPALGADRVPWPLCEGRSGLAEWSLEPRLPGARPGSVREEPLLGECLDFLAALHLSRVPDDGAKPIQDDAAEIASACSGDVGRAVGAIAEWAEAEVAELPRGFTHGDFFRGNLLVESGRLVGVVDWDAGGPGRLPLLDFVHLRHMGAHLPADRDWGATIVEHLLPWARQGGDEVLRGFCERIGIRVGPIVLEAIVAAYWLQRLAYQLSTYADRTERPAWMTRNVDLVVRAFPAGQRAS
jgi:aminoglycoside phosphotransferase (APT) family kinase protein